MALANAIPDFTQFLLRWSESIRKGETHASLMIFFKGLVKEYFGQNGRVFGFSACYFASTENAEDYLHVCAQWEKMTN